MARPKKVDEKPKDSGSLQISVEDFVRTRNSVSVFRFALILLSRDLTWSKSQHDRVLHVHMYHVVLPSIHHFLNSTMSQPQHHMSPDQSREALRSVELLTLPCLTICHVAYRLVRNIMYGVVNANLSELTVTPQVVTGLATLQSAVSDLSRAYIAHTDTVIGRGNSSSLEQLNISNPLSGGENALFGARGPTPAPTTDLVAEGKKRKRAPHDKNAPKRALTPFFLYLQTARNSIAEEMGPGKTAKEVQDEGGSRWRAMSDEDKSVRIHCVRPTNARSRQD